MPEHDADTYPCGHSRNSDADPATCPLCRYDTARWNRRISYYRSMDLDYFEGPLKLADLDALLSRLAEAEAEIQRVADSYEAVHHALDAANKRLAEAEGLLREAVTVMHHPTAWALENAMKSIAAFLASKSSHAPDR